MFSVLLLVHNLEVFVHCLPLHYIDILSPLIPYLIYHEKNTTAITTKTPP